MIQIQFNEATLTDIIKNAVNEAFEEKTKAIPSAQTGNCGTLHSIRELAEFLGCSTVTAQKYKNEGWIPFMQIGRKVIFDTSAVIKAIENVGKEKRK